MIVIKLQYKNKRKDTTLALDLLIGRKVAPLRPGFHSAIIGNFPWCLHAPIIFFAASFICFCFAGAKKFSSLITLFPVLSSSSSRAFWAMPPPFLPAALFSCKLFALFDVVVLPIIGEFIAPLLAHHALLNPFFAAAMFLPVLTRPLQRSFRLGHFLHAFVTNFGKPEFYRLGFRAWH